VGRLLLLVTLLVLRPPVFAGLHSATTCLPGPVGGDRLVRYHLRWLSAHDDRNPSSRIVYDVYRASSSGAESFTRPTWTTAPGLTSFTTPPLPSGATYFFVVRARDSSGRRDANRVERRGVNLCL